MKSPPFPVVLLTLMFLTLPSCHQEKAKPLKVGVTRPVVKSVTVAQQYLGQIQAQRYVKVRAFERGYLEEIPVKEGQRVKEGDLLFKVTSNLHDATVDVERANVQIEEAAHANATKNFEQNVISQAELDGFAAKLAKAQADLRAVELSLTDAKAPFDGTVGRLNAQAGALVQKGDVITTLSDSSILWVYFSVPEGRYLEYMADRNRLHDEPQVELMLADGSKFPQTGKIGSIDAGFNHETGSISFRADFQNPDGVLRHGQSATVLIRRVIDDVLVVPQKATFEMLHKRYVFVVDKNRVVRQREILVDTELEDLFVVKSGIGTDDTIVVEGLREIRDGDVVEYSERPEQVVQHDSITGDVVEQD
jgi:membrane fusion protein (multidrug efflux system)